jgi:hypothetical protein
VTAVLLVSLTVLAALVVWVVRRHRAAAAWSRELEVAFRTDERRELPRSGLFGPAR